MLGHHLDKMVRDRVRLVLISVMVIAVVVPIIESGDFPNGDVKIIEVGFRQEVEGNVMDVEEEQQRRRDSQPPGSRSWFGKKRPR